MLGIGGQSQGRTGLHLAARLPRQAPHPWAREPEKGCGCCSTCSSTQHRCQPLFIFNEPPGSLPSPLLERGRDRHRAKRACEISQRLMLRLGAGGEASQLQPWKLLAAPAASGPRAPGKEERELESLGEAELNSSVPAANPPFRILAPEPTEARGGRGQTSSKASGADRLRERPRNEGGRRERLAA